MESKKDINKTEFKLKQGNPNEFRVYTPTKPNSKIIIGELIINNKLKFNKLQKFMWKFLLNIKIKDVE